MRCTMNITRSARIAGIIAPTPHDRRLAYASTVDLALKKGTARLLSKAPTHLGKGIDITDPHSSDDTRTVFNRKGTLYLSEVGFTGVAQWYKIGPAPRF